MKFELPKAALAALMLVVGVSGAPVWAQSATQTPAPAQTPAPDQTPAPALTPAPAAEVVEMTLGEADAPVEVIEYASFTCPHCQRFHATEFEKIKKNYIDTGKVRFVYREVYFDRYGLWAGMVARCGGADRYFGMVSMLYDGQRQWLESGEPATIAASLKKVGRTAGMTEEKLEACLQDGDMAKALVASYQENATADGIDSTPSFVIDGKKYSNMAYDEFAEILDKQLAK